MTPKSATSVAAVFLLARLGLAYAISSAAGAAQAVNGASTTTTTRDLQTAITVVPEEEKATFNMTFPPPPGTMAINTWGGVPSESPTRMPTFASTPMAETMMPQPHQEMVNTPFDFTHIYFIGGVCQEMQEGIWKWVDGVYTADDVSAYEWNTRFFAAGLEAYRKEIDMGIAKHICSNVKGAADVSGGATTREFQLASLDQVLAEVGENKWNETLVITLGENLDSDWTPVADVLRKGVAVFHGGYTGASVSMNLTEYGLLPEDVLYFYFRLDGTGAAQRAGVELCRLKGGDQSIKIGKVTWAMRPDVLPRIEDAIAAFKVACPDTAVVEVWEVDYENRATGYKNSLLFKELPSLVFTFYDEAAKQLLDVAEELLDPNEFARFTTTGWDDMYPDLLAKKKILTTVDQMVFYPNRGLWKLHNTVTRTIQEAGYRSSKAVQAALDLGDSIEIVSGTYTVSSDTTGYLLSQLMRGYEANSPPALNVKVSTGLHSVTVTHMNAFEGKFETVVWLRASWTDPRLAWNPFVFEGELHVPPETIWTPSLYFDNAFEREDLYEAPAVVTAVGLVTTEVNVQIEFLCPTDSGLSAFPFDEYDCSIQLKSPNGISLDTSHGFDLLKSDRHFYTTIDIEVTPDQDAVFYELRFKRRRFTAYVRLILPAVLINLVGFMAFWIPEASDAVALGITSLLCSLAFRETVEMPDTSEVTWTEVFMMVNISYQALVMLIIWASYGSRHTARFLNGMCRCLHPVQLTRAAKSFTVKKSTLFGPGYNHDGIPLNDIAADDSAHPSASTNDENHDSSKNERVSFDVTDGLMNFQSSHSSIKFGDEEAKEEANDGILSSPKSALRQRGVVDPPIESTRRKRFDEDEYLKVRKAKFSLQRGSSIANLAGKISAAVISHLDSDTNVDWIGRWIIVPTYFVIMATLLSTGWGFT